MNVELKVSNGRISIPKSITGLYSAKTHYTIGDSYIEFGSGVRYFNPSEKTTRIKSDKFKDGSYSCIYKNQKILFLGLNQLGRSIIQSSDEVIKFVKQYDEMKKCLLSSQTSY
jgi:hypothetical protein